MSRRRPSTNTTGAGPPKDHGPSTRNAAPEARTPFLGTRLRWVVIVSLLVGAIGVRLYRLNDIPMDFHATRQFRSALIARSYYYQHLDTVSARKKRVAQEAGARQGILEPPVMEFLASIAYRLSGRERLWMPRLMSSVFWVIGGIFLFSLASRVVSPDGAIVCCAFYLFLPFAIMASRSFQPDPLMVMLFLAGLSSIVKYFELPSRRRLTFAVSFTGLALFIKPVCVFPLFSSFLLLAIVAHGGWRAARNKHVWLFVICGLLPAAAFYGYGTFIAGFLTGQARGSFVPDLFLQSSYWRGWLDKVEYVIGYPALVVALFGLILFRPGRPRTLAIALWGGYLAFGLVFNYHIYTHNYYHLFLIPIVALSIGSVADRVLQTVRHERPGRLSQAMVLVLLATGTALAVDQVHWSWYRRGKPEDFVKLAQSIGEAVDHSDRTVFLARDSGKPLMYYAEIAGSKWPETGEVRANTLRGRRGLSVEERFERLSRNRSPEYFIVTSLRDYARQKGLKKYLRDNFAVLKKKKNRYVIFDLRPDGETTQP